MRTVASRLDLYLFGDAELIFSVAVADQIADEESLIIRSGDVEIGADEILGRHGTRLHRAHAGQGPLTMEYSATIQTPAAAPEVAELDLIEYRRPSRYCESDTLFAIARAEFAGLEGYELLRAVDQWVRDRVRYVPGVSQVTDGAVKAFLARRGICRDSAHLVIALLRAMDVPARLVAVYAPGLNPMDFHAVAEAFVDGGWHVVDATGLAPRGSMVRIATGQDASETAFMTRLGAAVNLNSISVQASATQLSADDGRGLATLQ